MSTVPVGFNGKSDAELIASVRAGTLADYGVLYERHVSAAYNLARQLSWSKTESDDLVSEAFAKVLDILRAGKGPDSAFRAYLLATLRHNAYHKARRDQRVDLNEDMTTVGRAGGAAADALTVQFSDTAVAGLERTFAAKAFARLPERWQAVLWHTEIEQQAPADIAPVLGLTANGVSALASRAREGLRQAYLQVHLAETAAERCRATAERLGAWTRHGLSKRERAQVERHLDECSGCRALAAELADVNSALRAVVAPIVLGGAASGYLTTTMGTETDGTPAGPTAAQRATAGPRQFVGVAVSGAAIAAAVAAALAAGAGESPRIPNAAGQPLPSAMVPTPELPLPAMPPGIPLPIPSLPGQAPPASGGAASGLPLPGVPPQLPVLPTTGGQTPASSTPAPLPSPLPNTPTAPAPTPAPTPTPLPAAPPTAPPGQVQSPIAVAPPTSVPPSATAPPSQTSPPAEVPVPTAAPPSQTSPGQPPPSQPPSQSPPSSQAPPSQAPGPTSPGQASHNPTPSAPSPSAPSPSAPVPPAPTPSLPVLPALTAQFPSAGITLRPGGDPSALSITVHNDGGSASGPVSATLNLPDGIRTVSHGPGTGALDCPPARGTVTCGSTQGLRPGQAAVFTLWLAADPGAGGGVVRGTISAGAAAVPVQVPLSVPAAPVTSSAPARVSSASGSMPTGQPSSPSPITVSSPSHDSASPTDSASSPIGTE
ncbi:MAG TPA: sigma-70 family RNA polymerase sigma factor [Amycolatopsis sp.]|nr:sigma-70 family RNA polymerase sigma factor [Amycolatopsis sp.]